MTAEFPGAAPPVELRTPEAVERATAERDRIERKVEAFAEFGERVGEVTADAGQQAGGQQVGGRESGAPARSATGTSAESAVAVGPTRTNASADVATVRDAFRETVAPFADADSMQEAMADELSPDLTAALSPAAGGFTPGLKRQLVSRAEQRHRECRLLADAVGTERERVREVAEELERITDWLVAADETPLRRLGFEDLRERHDRLAAFRTTCDRLAGERQAAVRGTRNDGLTGIRESELLDHLYGEFEVDHPALADLACADDLLADCQRAVRDHLCVRV